MSNAIRQLDQRIQAIWKLEDTSRPGRGWIRAVRNALGMTTAQFARRMGVSQPRAVTIEKSEANRSITLKTLERAAEALDCRVVYFLVPSRSLEDLLRFRAEYVADR